MLMHLDPLFAILMFQMASDVFEKDFISTGAIWKFISYPVLLFHVYYMKFYDFSGYSLLRIFSAFEGSCV